MMNNIFKLIIVIALVTLLINIFPIIFTWVSDLITWLLSSGKWGIIFIFSSIILFFIDFIPIKK